MRNRRKITSLEGSDDFLDARAKRTAIFMTNKTGGPQW